MNEAGVDDFGLAGRERELEQVRAMVETGAPQGIMIFGGAGLGKTRLVTAAAQAASAAGLGVASLADTGSTPSGSLAEALPSVINLIMAQSTDAGLLVVIDDVDRLSEIEGVAARSAIGYPGVRFVVAVRSSGILPEAILQLSRLPGVVRVDLEPLGVGATDEVVRAVTGGEPVDGLTPWAWRLTGGNPGLLCRLLERALSSEVVVVADGKARLTRRPLLVAGLLDHRDGWWWNDLDDAQRDVIEIVAAGQPVPVDLLLDRADPSAVVDLEQAGLLVVADDWVSLARLLDGLVVVSALGVVRRRSTLENLARGASDRSGAVEREASLRWREALGEPLAPDELVELADWRLGARDAAGATRVASLAWRADHGLGPTRALAAAHLLAGEPFEAIALLDDGAGSGSTEEPRLDALRLRAFVDAGCPAWIEAVPALDPDTDGGELGGAEVVERCRRLTLLGRPAEALELLGGLSPAAGSAVHERAAVGAEAALLLGDMVGARRWLASAPPAATGFGSLRAGGRAGRDLELMRAWLALAEGDFTEAADRAAAAFEAGVRARDAMGVMAAAVVSSVVAALQGRVRDARRWTRWAEDLTVDVAWLSDAVSLLRGVGTPLADGPAIAHAASGGLWGTWARVARCLDADTGGVASVAVAAGVVRELARSGFVVHAAVLAVLLPQDAVGDIGALNSDSRLVANLVDVRRAVVRADAEALLRGATVLSAAGGHRLALRVASLAAPLTTPGERAADLVAEVSARSVEAMGAPEEATRRDLLSPREREVAALAAGGMPSKVIAGRLGVSRRTVDNLLQRAYKKTGVHRRADLARVLADASSA